MKVALLKRKTVKLNKEKRENAIKKQTNNINKKKERKTYS